LLDDYQRKSSKTARDYPTKGKRKRTGVPKIAIASKPQINAAKESSSTNPTLRLPA
jgi:hypothetical protein